MEDDHEQSDRALSPPVEVELYVFPAHECSYLPGRMATTRGIFAEKIPGELYHAFMDRGFRRSGKFIYQPVCEGCRECVPIRVRVGEFVPSKSQRRASRRNADVAVTVGIPVATQEKFELYSRYVMQRHEGKDLGEYADFERFLYDSPVDSAEFLYRDAAGKLIGVGICDVCAESLSSVYFYFEPGESRRSLGVYSALWEIEFAREYGIPYCYLGYWVKGCGKMSYKAEYRPGEVLTGWGKWVRIEEGI